MSEDSYLDTVREGKEIVKRRGDSFDIGEITEPATDDILVKIMQNPRQLQDVFGVTEEQAENIVSAIIGAGAGVSAKYLSKHFGHSVSGAFGGFLTGLIVDKILKKE